MIFHVTNGGAALNFKVLGGTERPENPSKNTIWANTDAEIPGWAVSPQAPEKSEGLLWIRSGLESANAFNALNQNEIRIMPLSASQCIGGEWVSVPAQIYQDGWSDLVSWSGELYSNGNQYEDITGGWVKGEGNASATISDSGITLSTSGESASRIHVETAKPVNLTDFKTLRATVNVSKINLGSSISNGRVRLGYSASPKANLASSGNKVEKQITSTGTVTMQLDISSVEGDFYIVLGIGFYTITVKPDRIWLE